MSDEEKPDTKALVQRLRGTVSAAMHFAEPTMKAAVSKAVDALEIDQGLKEEEPESEESAEGSEGEQEASGDDEVTAADEEGNGRRKRSRHR